MNISDDELLLYYYRELDAADRARVGAALSANAELSQRLHRLIARLDAVAAAPEVPVPAEVQQRWRGALAHAAATRDEAAPAKRARPFTSPQWLASAAAVVVAVIALVAMGVWQKAPPDHPEVVSVPPTTAAGDNDTTAYEHGLKRHLASTERQLVSLESASPEDRARLIEAIIGQNRIYALAAERAGEPQLARVLRAFTPVLEDVASGRAASTEGSVAQLAFELRIMQSRLGPDAAPSNNL